MKEKWKCEKNNRRNEKEWKGKQVLKRKKKEQRKDPEWKVWKSIRKEKLDMNRMWGRMKKKDEKNKANIQKKKKENKEKIGETIRNFQLFTIMKRKKGNSQ